jgi:hypothetical protein
MCDPATAMLALSVASAGASYIGGQQNASATANAARDNLNRQAVAQAEQQTQINAQATDKKTQAQRQAEIAQGKLAAVSGESGVALNGDILLRDSEMAKATDIATIEGNRMASIKQSKSDMGALETNADNTTTEAYNKAPTLIGTGLQIGGAYATYKSKQP